MSQTDNTPTEIYLDMDGVLADFFAEYAKLAGVTTGSYRDIPPAKVDPTLDKMIGTDFFARLPMFKTVPQLLKLVLSYADHYNICSSPLRGDNKNSEQHKRVWISKHLNPLPKDIIITGRKPKWATQPDGTPNILIDDRGKNIRDWIAAGGYGIKYQADEDSLEIVKMGLDRFFKGDVQEPQDSDLMVSTRATQEPKETYKRSELPQVTKEHLNYIPHTVETVDLEVVCPVQKERVTENLQKQYKRLTENRFAPIVVDKNYRIINGHHRYEVLKQLNSGYVEVARIPLTLEEVKTVMEKWSAKYKKSIDCSNPKGFSQKAHCAGRKKKNENIEESIIVEHPAVIAALAAAGVTIRELVKRYGFNAVKKALDKAKTQKPNLQKPANDHGGYVDDLLKAVNKKRTPDEIARAQQMNFPRALDNAKAMIRHSSKDLKAGKLSREEFTNIMRYLRVNFKRKTGKELPIDDLLKVVENFADGKKKDKSRPSRIDWTALRNAGAVQPMLYYPGGKDPETGKIIPPDVNQPNIITAVNLKQELPPGEELVPLSTRSMTDDQWQKYMDDWWAKAKNDPNPDAKAKIDQIKQSAREKDIVFRENFADGKINEVLDNPASYTWRRDEFGFPTAEAKELGLHIAFDGRNQPQWEVSFYREQEDGSFAMNHPTGQGKEFEVFATVNAAIKDFMKMHDDVEGLTLDARKDGGVDGQGRVSLYRRMMKQYAKKLGWEFEGWDQGQMVMMGIYKPRTNENFADGKKKGKSRPGRVKRAGASCKGSVSSLRKKAKNASGEKAKMYHWCANMKSGRKKG